MKGKALLAGCIALAFSTMARADIKVAVVGAMSGPVAQYGDREFTGAEQAVADINAKGGIKGEKLQIVKYDDACDPKQAVAVANKVVNDGSNTLSVTCAPLPPSPRLTSTKTKAF